MLATALVLAQPQLDTTNSMVLYAIGGVLLAGVVLAVWRLYVTPKFAAGNRPDGKGRPR